MALHIFLSSTYRDLKEYRDAVYIILRRLGNVVEIDDYVSSDQSPLEKRLADVRISDVLVLLVAWNYGYIPPGQEYSLTELELRAAESAGIPCLVFFAGEKATLPANDIDYNSARVNNFRNHLLKKYPVSFFNTPDELALQVVFSLNKWDDKGRNELLPVAPGIELNEDIVKPDIFLSYAHEDIGIAKSVSERIRQEKWTVFFDRTIPVGFTWDAIVEGALDDAKCVVVLWSVASRNSEWVRIEATEGVERKILTPAVIEKTKIPIRFRMIQSADLIGWNLNAPDTDGMKALISAIARVIRNRVV